MSHRINPDDPRVIRTRKLLRQALIELVPSKGYDALTIHDITHHATLNRATFYLHYKDKEALLLDVFAQLMAEGIPTPPAEGISREAFDASRPIQAVLTHVSQYAAFYRAMLGEAGVPLFMARVREHIESIIQSWLHATILQQLPADTSIEILVNYIGAAHLGVISWWLEHDMPYSIKEMESQLMRITTQGIEGFIAAK